MNSPENKMVAGSKQSVSMLAVSSPLSGLWGRDLCLFIYFCVFNEVSPHWTNQWHELRFKQTKKKETSALLTTLMTSQLMAACRHSNKSCFPANDLFIILNWGLGGSLGVLWSKEVWEPLIQRCDWAFKLVWWNLQMKLRKSVTDA